MILITVIGPFGRLIRFNKQSLLDNINKLDMTPF